MYANNSQLVQSLHQCEQVLQQLIHQTHQASMNYQQLLQQEQQNAQRLEELAQREQKASQMIQTALQGHQTAIQQMQQVSTICRQAEQMIQSQYNAVPLVHNAQAHPVQQMYGNQAGMPSQMNMGGFRSFQ